MIREGCGGGFKYNPGGHSPGYSDSPDNWMFTVGAGAFGEASFGLGPAYAGISGNAGLISRSQCISGYAGVEAEAGLEWGWALRGGAAVGGEIIFS